MVATTQARMMTLLVVGSFSVALAAALGAPATTHVPMLRVSSPLAISTRLAQPSMHFQHPQDGLNEWWNPGNSRASQRSAAYRAQERAMRNQGRRPRYAQPQPGAPPQPGYGSSFNPPSMMPGLEPAWVLIFNAGQHNEGVYTMQEQDRDRPTMFTAVLAFEFADDANDFAQLLLAKGFDLATPLFWSGAQLATFCDTTGFEVSRVPSGTLPPPPSNTFDPLGDTGSEPQRRFMGAEDRGWEAGLDSHVGYRMWLEELFLLRPQDCGDDDCIIH